MSGAGTSGAGPDAGSGAGAAAGGPRVDPAIEAVEGPVAFWDDDRDLIAGLAEPVPRIPPRFGYDERGSRLFEQITELPTYYLTRVEHALLERHADEIAAALGTTHLMELGSGSARKTRLLLAACLRRGPLTYLPVDVSHEMLAESSRRLRAALPGLAVRGLWGRYEAALDRVPQVTPEPVVVAFLGSSLGNTTVPERRALLRRIGDGLRPGDGLLLSADLRKPAEVLDRCYNDPPGAEAFAQFRLNHLVHLNRRFGGDFQPGAFTPRASYVPERGEVEGHLYARTEQVATLHGPGVTVRVPRGGSINVGISAKFDLDELRGELAEVGLHDAAGWSDPEHAYTILLLRSS